MIGRLTGTVIDEEADGALVLDVPGVGYEIFAPLGTLGRAPRTGSGGAATTGAAATGAASNLGLTVTLYIHTHVREEAFTLFGFAGDVDRTAFRTLIGVSNVGPKTAIAILSALPGADLARAVAEKNLGRLTSISGVGKKTAERLLLELRDKLPIDPASAPIKPLAAGAPPAQKNALTGNAELLHGALLNLGYRPVEADRAVAALNDRLADAALPELIRESLAVLAKK